MAKNGYRIFDSDTHVGPFMEVLEPYLSEGEKSRLAVGSNTRPSTKMAI